MSTYEAKLLARTMLLHLSNGYDGGTYNADGYKIEPTGYVVGGKAPSFTFTETYQGLAKNLSTWFDANPSKHYGYWVDSDDGTVYVDAVDMLDDQGEAMLEARHRGELAIWDCGKSEEIRVGEDGICLDCEVVIPSDRLRCPACILG